MLGKTRPRPLVVDWDKSYSSSTCTRFFRAIGILSYGPVADLDHTTIWRQGWRSRASLGLPKVDFSEWDRYRQTIRESHIHLQDRLDELIWDGDPSGHYSLKAGYV